MSLRNSFFLAICVLVISSCRLPFSRVEPTPEGTPTPPVVPTSTSAPRSLTICLGNEPNTLYPFGGPNAAGSSILETIQDGPIDSVDYGYQPVILTQLPSLANGDAQVSPAAVKPGDRVVDANGDVVLMEAGVRLRPASCRTDECLVTYDGISTLELDQMIVTFRLRPDLSWSDGTPITSDDSIYAYTLASDPSSVIPTYLIDRTAIYEAADPQTVQWWGLPGFLDPTYFTNFWPPAPKHAWSQFPAEQLLTVDVSSRTPLGWGPYVIQEWAAGDHIRLTKNPRYLRAADGYPKFDTLTFRFTPDPNTAISELTAGRCDILDPSVRLDGQAALLTEMEKGEQLQAFFTTGMTVEWLGFGIFPASYDNGYDSRFAGDRQDIFADPHTRQGIAYCVDRQKITDTVLFGLTGVPDTYIPPDHPLYETGVPVYPHDPAAGKVLLDQAGWRDIDGDPNTPLSAVSVTNVAAGTPLQLNYFTTGATQRRQVTELLSQSLAECGVGLNVQFLSQNDLYAAGPEGPLFGRRFDLVEYAMSLEGFELPCAWFTSTEIPSASNYWVGTNVTGFKDELFDAACNTARAALPDEPSYADGYHQTQLIFSRELPALPLYFRMKTAAARKDMCHFDLDPSANPLWNIEAFDYGPACQN